MANTLLAWSAPAMTAMETGTSGDGGIGSVGGFAGGSAIAFAGTSRCLSDLPMTPNRQRFAWHQGNEGYMIERPVTG